MHHARLSPHQRLRDDEPVALAKHAIRVLEEKLASQFNVKPVMGAELEFGILPRGDDTFLGILGKEQTVIHNGIDDIYAPSVTRVHLERDNWFPDSHRVAYSYRESPQPHTLWQQAEVVISHQPTRGADSLSLARTIEAMRHHLRTLPRGYKPGSSMTFDGLQHYAKWKPLHRTIGDTIRFDASIAGANIHNGMHLNCSFIDSRTGETCLDDDRTQRHCMNGISAMCEENLYLLGSSYPALERFMNNFGRGANTQHHLCKAKHQALASYVENRIPPADANPYYAVMLQLAGMYRTLQQQDRDADPQARVSTAYEKLSPALLYQRHTKGTLLRDTLNRVEPGLGEKFMSGIVRHPPGQERTAQQKLHAERDRQ